MKEPLAKYSGEGDASFILEGVSICTILPDVSAHLLAAPRVSKVTYDW